MLKLKLQYFGCLMWWANSLEKTLMLGKIEGRRRRGRQRMRRLDSIIDSIDTNLSQLWEIKEDRGAWHAAVHGVAKSRTWLSNWTSTTLVVIVKRQRQMLFKPLHRYTVRESRLYMHKDYIWPLEGLEAIRKAFLWIWKNVIHTRQMNNI